MTASLSIRCPQTRHPPPSDASAMCGRLQTVFMSKRNGLAPTPAGLPEQTSYA